MSPSWLLVLPAVLLGAALERGFGKAFCVDHRLLRTGSANFSRSGETRQDNDLVALRGGSACAGFEAKFDRAWGRS
jgi:hypothetical protein